MVQSPLQFTYSGDPSTSDLEAVRFLIGDTVEAVVLFDDREILYQLSLTPNLRIAGAELMETKARQYAQKADIRVGDVSKSLSKLSDQMFKAAQQLRDDALRLAKPFFGGLTKTGKQELAQATDDVQPAFAIGMTDDPSATQLNEDISNLDPEVLP